MQLNEFGMSRIGRRLIDKKKTVLYCVDYDMF